MRKPFRLVLPLKEPQFQIPWKPLHFLSCKSNSISVPHAFLPSKAIPTTPRSCRKLHGTSQPVNMADSTTAAPRKKKLLFKRTTSRTNGATNSKKEDDDDDGVSLFRRVDDELPEVLEEQERRLREKEKRSSSWSAVKTDPDDHDVKRRKLSIDRDDDDHTTRGTRHSVSTRYMLRSD